MLVFTWVVVHHILSCLATQVYRVATVCFLRWYLCAFAILRCLEYLDMWRSDPITCCIVASLSYLINGYYQPQWIPSMVWTALVTWYMCHKLACTKILQKIWLTQVLQCWRFNTILIIYIYIYIYKVPKSMILIIKIIHFGIFHYLIKCQISQYFMVTFFNSSFLNLNNKDYKSTENINLENLREKTKF